MTLERNHLQLLVALARFGRLGDAAEHLHISASAASHRLAEAERRAATPLTEQQGRTLRLTPAGRHLADVAATVEADLERAELTSRWIGSGETERVRIAIGFHDTAGWLLDTFDPEPGEARSEVLRFSDDRLIGRIRAGDADLAIAAWAPPPSGLRHEILAADRLVAAVPVASPLASREALSPADLVDETFLTSSYLPALGFEFREFFLAAGEIPSTVVQVQSMEMMLRLVGTGHGVTIQPALTVEWNRPHSDVGIVPLTGTPIVVTWAALMRPDADPAVARVARRIADAFTSAAGAVGE